jgi:GNAT superfamily N-acetyltransferase
MHIREAQPRDLPALVALLSQLHEDDPEDYPGRASAYDAAFAAIAADPRQRLYVIEHEGAIAGSAQLVVVPNLTHGGRPYAVIESVVIDRGLRSRGYGERLMRRLIDEAQAAGCYKVALTSHRSRADAHRFYERLGFAFAHKGYRLDL